MDGATETLHATTIALGGRAALIRGPSGCGKSDLALRCLSLGPSAIIPHAARLVADDQTLVTRHGNALFAQPPATIAGRLEVRGVGIVTVDYETTASVALIVDLAACDPQPRHPDPWPFAAVLGLQIPVLRLAAFEASAAAKLLAALVVPTLPAVTTASR